ncbi:MAG: TetR/AcrR family transcriptional regulator [Butyrivibrio sp.]|nr:TetR/AcrR family transcriptional regulator [Butyrivibrio sp.]
MPPRAKITKEMVVDAAFEVARADGIDNINARTVAGKLNCSTQPVMYHFATIEELKKAAYAKADDYHTKYLMNIPKAQETVMLRIGLNYIRFAVEEPNLFRFLFQSGYAVGNSLPDMINSEGLTPVLSAMQEAMKMDLEQTKEVFITLAMFVHGYASIIANNSLEYDEKLIAMHLERVYKGAVLAIQEKKYDESDRDWKIYCQMS